MILVAAVLASIGSACDADPGAPEDPVSSEESGASESPSLLLEVRGSLTPPAQPPTGIIRIADETDVLIAFQEAVTTHHEWVIDGTQHTVTDPLDLWPEPVPIKPGHKAVLELDGHFLPTAIEINNLRSLDPHHVDAEYGTDYYCSAIALIQHACDLQIIDKIQGEKTWQAIIPSPSTPGLYYIVIWARWTDFQSTRNDADEGRYHVTWRFLLDHISE